MIQVTQWVKGGIMRCDPMGVFPYIISLAIYSVLTRHVSIFSSLPECQLAAELLNSDPDQTGLNLSLWRLVSRFGVRTYSWNTNVSPNNVIFSYWQMITDLMGEQQLWSLADWVNTADRPWCICFTLTGQGQSGDYNFAGYISWRELWSQWLLVPSVYVLTVDQSCPN